MRAWGKKEGEEGTEGGEKKERLPKKKVAVLIGYNGTAYLGSQMYVRKMASRRAEEDAFAYNGPTLLQQPWDPYHRRRGIQGTC